MLRVAVSQKKTKRGKVGAAGGLSNGLAGAAVESKGCVYGLRRSSWLRTKGFRKKWLDIYSGAGTDMSLSLYRCLHKKWTHLSRLSQCATRLTLELCHEFIHWNCDPDSNKLTNRVPRTKKKPCLHRNSYSVLISHLQEPHMKNVTQFLFSNVPSFKNLYRVRNSKAIEQQFGLGWV